MVKYIGLVLHGALILAITRSFFLEIVTCDAYHLQHPAKAKDMRWARSSSTECWSSRRKFLSSSFGVCLPFLLSTDSASGYDSNDLTSQIYNEDGSLKEGVVSQAKERTVSISWDTSDSLQMNVDGSNINNTPSGSRVKLTYMLPEKWISKGETPYVDTSEGVDAPACRKITVYKPAGKVEASKLEKAATNGVGKSLSVPGELDAMIGADVVGGRKADKDDLTYYEFDLAVAPKTCGNSNENLGLGFCPFDSIYLVSCTIVDGDLYAIVVESSKDEWRQGNAELKRIRSSFSIENVGVRAGVSMENDA